MANADTNDEAILGTLINRCGKMRMLSHRVVVTLLLEGTKETPCSKAMDELEKDLTEFSKISSDVAPGSKETAVPGHVRRVLEKVEAVGKSQNDTLVEFVTNARLIQHRLKEKGGSHLTKIIEDLAQFVKTTLLATLNSIVEGINRALDHVVSTRQAQSGKQTKMLSSSISELEKISRMIMIISVNASIEASRVGEAGRGFSAVATEIRGLSQSANKVITSLRTQFENQ
ncbi:methyl-accepting chemotaxis protein [Marivita sp.]|uniref:methyl-accepting chemotaxis protein n=1 Tax=Marivita sp. TaxID=2003365 RepID=UPI002613EF51|nr:methyl-accepting chemotaxis protein [Marivita sp.]